jgi:hypothetical protein
MDLQNATIRFAEELRGLARDAKQPAKKREVAAYLADALVRPLLLGLFGEFGAGQFALINNLLRHQACPPDLALGKRPLTLIRHSETPAMFSIKNNGATSRLTSRGIAQIAQRRNGTARESARVIYKARKPVSASTTHGGPALANAMSGGDEADEVSAIEIQLPAAPLSQLEICEFAADEPLLMPPRFSRLPMGRRPDVAAWVTLANGAWKRSESLTWNSLSLPPSSPRLLLITDNESLTGDSRARLEARLKDSTQSEFSERLYLSLKDASALLGSGKAVPDEQWQATGIPQLEARLSAHCARIRSRNLDRARRILEELDRRKPRNGPSGPTRLPA